MGMSKIFTRKIILIFIIFTVTNIVFYFCLCISNDIFFSLFKSGYWTTIFKICNDIMLMFQILTGYVTTLFALLLR
uniref:Uncharacterized protein n=1 Tax=Caldicellulosiruptor owensensis TaxID=55205 RepID=A0A7C5V660_9FIRM